MCKGSVRFDILFYCCLCCTEEELKRLNEEVGGSYGAVNFDYNAPPAEEEEEAPATGQEGSTV